MDTVSKETRSYIMSRIRSESAIEILPSEFRGLYLRKHPKQVFGKPDFGNKTRKIALFLDGVFWHGKKPWKCPKTNAAFWRKKIKNNRKRDKLVTKTLLAAGWTVTRLWESELKKGEA